MIIETIIAVALITFALISPLSAAKSSLVTASDVRDYIESVYLADELMEYVRMIRDNNVFEGSTTNWLRGLDKCIDNYCGISVSEKTNHVNNPSNIISCVNPELCELYYDEDTGIYSYDVDGKASGITRRVSISESNDGTKALVTVTIDRERLNFPKRTYTMRGSLMNWKSQLSPL